MTDEPHPAVKLLLARMESNPEEFSAYENRWREVMHKVMTYCIEEEKALLNDKLRSIVLNDAHEEIMRELLGAEDKEPELKKVTWNRLTGVSSLQNAAQQQNSSLVNALQEYNNQQQADPYLRSAVQKINSWIYGGKK